MRLHALALLLGLLACQAPARRSPVPPRSSRVGSRGATFSAEIAEASQSPNGGVRLVFRGHHEIFLNLHQYFQIPPALTVGAVQVPRRFAQVADGQTVATKSLEPGTRVRVVAVLTTGGQLEVGAVFSLRDEKPDRLWYCRRFFEQPAHSADPGEGLLYALTTGELSHYNMTTGNREFVWIVDSLKDTLGYFANDRVAHLWFSRYQGEAFAEDSEAISRLLAQNESRMALVQGLPFMPVGVEYNLVGGLGVFPLAIYLDRGEKGVEKVFEHRQ